MVVKSYYAVLSADTGLLLGGVQRVQSSRFKKRYDAAMWLDTIIIGNEQAGRHLTNPNIIKSDCDPEIF